MATKSTKSASTKIGDLLSIAQEAALQGGKHIREQYSAHKELIIREKKKNDFVTNLDIESEQIIKKIIKNYNPKAKIIGEEEGEEGNNSESVVWFVDPLDGTSAFIRSNIAFVSVSVAAVDNKSKQVLAGVIYNPFTEMLYTASGKDAFLNNSVKLTNSQIVPLKKARILIDYSDDHPSFFRKILGASDVDRVGRILRYDGSFAQHMCLIANGTLDGALFWGFGDKGNFYDLASALLICRNAGLLVTDLTGKDISFSSKAYDQLVVAPQELHKELMAFVHEISFLSIQNLSELESEILLYLRDSERSIQMRNLKNKFPKVTLTNLQKSLTDLKEKNLILMSKSWIKLNTSK